MAAGKKDPVTEKAKNSIRNDIERVGLAADYATGVKTPSGKVFNNPKKQSTKTTQEKSIDIDDFLRLAESGFTELTPEKNDKPFNGTLGDVKIQRLTKGDGKY